MSILPVFYPDHLSNYLLIGSEKLSAYVYILRCSDDTLYTGWTNDLDKRISLHNEGKASKYTRARLPVRLVYFEEHENKIVAQKREWEIKQLTRQKKLALCATKEPCK